MATTEPTSTPGNDDTNNTNEESVSERFQKAVSVLNGENPGASAGNVVGALTEIQRQVANMGLFSDNEELSEISTGSLPFLALEHYLAMALMHVPTGPQQLLDRKNNLRHACDLWSAYLHQLEKLDQLSTEEKSQYEHLVEVLSSLNNDEGDGSGSMPPSLPGTISSRDAKIARFRAKQGAEQEQQRLRSLLARRNRIGLSDEEELDGYDAESLSRSLATTTLQICKAEALDEFANTLRELPMISMMVKSQLDRQLEDRYRGGGRTPSASQQQQQQMSRLPPSNKPLQLTHITQDTGTGQLLIRKEEVKSKVFQRGWNQPTMSLDELADRERAEAIARSERQEQAEASQQDAPRRYEQLVKDGREDDADLVDASAALDRKWDDFKDENPRGSGNKRGDVGDRNF